MHDKIKRWVAAVVVMLGGVLGSFTVASPARAALADCTWGNLCIWDGTQYTGILYQWHGGYILNQQYGCVYLSGSQNNMASSLAMKYNMPTGYRAYFFNGNGGGTPYLSLSPSQAGWVDSDLRNNSGTSAGLNNQISSICVRQS